METANPGTVIGNTVGAGALGSPGDRVGIAHATPLGPIVTGIVIPCTTVKVVTVEPASVLN